MEASRGLHVTSHQLQASRQQQKREQCCVQPGEEQGGRNQVRGKGGAVLSSDSVARFFVRLV